METLKKGDKVIVIAPSGKITFERVKLMAEVLISWGLVVDFGKNVGNNFFRFAATDEARLLDLQESLDSEQYKAIFCARGGYGLTRIIDDLNWEKFILNPKWLIGYSDVTTLLIALANKNIPSIHALHLSQYDEINAKLPLSALYQLLFEGTFEVKAKPNIHNRIGNCNAIMLGGNLSLLTRTIGTPDDFDTEGKILFIEDINEPAYKIDGMIVQLKRAGKLNKLAGLVVGQFSQMPEDKDFWCADIAEMIAFHLKDYHYPIAFDFPIGHEMPAFPIKLNVLTEFNVQNETVWLKSLS